MAGNSNSGRRKTPTSLLKLRGSRWADDRPNEPERVDGAMECPQHFDKHARECWQIYYPMLMGNGVLSMSDVASFCLLCQTWSNLQRARIKSKAQGRYHHLKNKRGMTVGSTLTAWARDERDFTTEFIRLCREFGLTPASRPNIEVNKAEAQVIEVDDIL